MNTIIILSGGIDSAVLLYKLIAENHTVKAISFNYGQRHNIELGYAAQLTTRLNIDHNLIPMESLRWILAGSSQTSEEVDVPHGHYAEESMKSTVVPNRNMIMLAIAIGWGVSLNYDAVAIGVHSGDHTIYPDCRPEFIAAMSKASELGNWHSVPIYAPFLGWTKAQIVGYGSKIGVPFGSTYSCYEGDRIHCGKCGTCMERKEAFTLAGVKDPTSYKG